MELNVWTSASVEKVVQDKSSGKWMVTVRRANGDRTFKVNHVIFATGIGGGKGNVPVYPGMVRYRVSIWRVRLKGSS